MALKGGKVDGIATLLYAIAAVIGAFGSAVAVVINASRSSRRERMRGAQGAAGRLAEAAADGEITKEELIEVLQELRNEADGGDDSR